MFKFLKEGYEKIKDTKKYAREKNVLNWFMPMVISIITVYTSSCILVLLGILFLIPNDPHIKLPDFSNVIIPYLPFIVTFLFMIKYGSYPIKGFILVIFYMQKALMKLINRLDMILWKKTGKDCMVSGFISKHQKITRMIFFIPLVIWMVNDILHF